MDYDPSYAPIARAAVLKALRKKQHWEYRNALAMHLDLVCQIKLSAKRASVSEPLKEDEKLSK